MKIGILHCKKASEVCAGVGCMNAFFEKKDFFKVYENEEIRLSAFFTCNGCKSQRNVEPEEDEGIIEKLDRLKSEDVKVVHIGVCRNTEHGKGKECMRITKMAQMIEDRGIKVIRGTHRE